MSLINDNLSLDHKFRHLARAMNKKAYLVVIGCFIVGVLIGIGGACFCGGVYSGKQIADGLALIREVEIAESGNRAYAEHISTRVHR